MIGNVVFFALLYFIQYRPNSRENRAGELLTLAQREEAEHRLEAADSLYAMILADYPDERPAAIAEEEAIAKITTHRATDRRKQDETNVSADASMYSHDRHGIIFGFCEQANSYASRISI